MRRAAAALLATALLGCRPGARRDLDSPDPVRRAAAVQRLGSSRDPADLAPLLVAQQDPDPSVRKAAASAYGARGGTSSADGLAAMLADPDPDVVALAARALGTIRPDERPTDAGAAADLHRRAALALAAAYPRADSPGRAEIAASLQLLGGSLREAVEAEARWLWERNARELSAGSAAGRPGAAEELGRSGRAEAERLLLALLEKGDHDGALAAAVARGLGWSADAAAVEALEPLLGSRRAEVAEAAAWALGNLGDVQAGDPLAGVGSTGPYRVARAAVAALDVLPPAPETGVALCEVAVRSPDPEVAAEAAAAARAREADCPERVLAQRIGRGGPEALGALAAFGALGLQGDRLKGPGEKALALLQSSGDARVRAAAARALGRAPYPPAVPSLARRSSATDPEELGEVVVALARLAPAEAVPLATRLVDDPRPPARERAARALGIARPPGAAEALARLARDPEPAVRTAALASLGKLGSAGLPALSAAVDALPDEEEGEALAQALGATGEAGAAPLLARLLAGPQPGPAAVALGRLGRPEGIPVLLGALAGGQRAGRVEVIESLTLLGTPEAGEPLTAELTSDRPEIRTAAARGLGRLRHEGAASRLEALRSDYYASVRRAAVEALARLPSRAPTAAPARR